MNVKADAEAYVGTRRADGGFTWKRVDITGWSAQFTPDANGAMTVTSVIDEIEIRPRRSWFSRLRHWLRMGR